MPLKARINPLFVLLLFRCLEKSQFAAAFKSFQEESCMLRRVYFLSSLVVKDNFHPHYPSFLSSLWKQFSFFPLLSYTFSVSLNFHYPSRRRNLRGLLGNYHQGSRGGNFQTFLMRLSLSCFQKHSSCDAFQMTCYERDRSIPSASLKAGRY